MTPAKLVLELNLREGSTIGSGASATWAGVFADRRLRQAYVALATGEERRESSKNSDALRGGCVIGGAPAPIRWELLPCAYVEDCHCNCWSACHEKRLLGNGQLLRLILGARHRLHERSHVKATTASSSRREHARDFGQFGVKSSEGSAGNAGNGQA